MPHMRIHKSGGIVFVPTKEEQEVRKIKQELNKELESVKKLRQELEELVKDAKGKN